MIEDTMEGFLDIDLDDFKFEDTSSSKDTDLTVDPPELKDNDTPTDDPPAVKPPVIEDNNDDPDDDTASPTTLEFLKSQGLLVVPDDFDFSADDAEEQAAKLTRDAYRADAFESIWSAIPPDFQSALQYAFAGGDSLKDYYENFNVDYDNLKLDTVEEQRNIITRYYKTASKKTDEQIQKIVNRLEDSDLLSESAAEYLQELKDIQTEKLEALNNKAETDRRNAKIAAEKAITEISNAITQQVEDTTKQSKIKGFFFNELQTEDGKGTEFDFAIRSIKSNPQHLVQLGTILVDAYDPKKGFNLEKFIKQGESRANKSIKTLLDQKIDSKAKVKGSVSESKTSSGINLSQYFDY